MRVAFRVDASLRIGSGHVMRCLALADYLKAAGAVCCFVAREHEGHLGSTILERGHGLSLLSPVTPKPDMQGYAAWLGTDWQTDATQTLRQLPNQGIDWMVVDHYGLDRRWEANVRQASHHLLVIDDLADRPHCCDLLLDQNLGHAALDYAELTSEGTRLLIGPLHALMRPGFGQLREATIARRFTVKQPTRLLVSLGGVDAGNVTGQLLEVLAQLPNACITSLDVVLGKQAPHQEAVRAVSRRLNIPCKLHVGTPHMARLVAEVDAAIGATGVSAWERCALGLPSLLVVLAENQRSGAQALVNSGAALWLGESDRIIDELPRAWQRLQDPDVYREMHTRAATVADGRGAERVAAAMKEFA